MITIHNIVKLNLYKSNQFRQIRYKISVSYAEVLPRPCPASASIAEASAASPRFCIRLDHCRQSKRVLEASMVFEVHLQALTDRVLSVLVLPVEFEQPSSRRRNSSAAVSESFFTQCASIMGALNLPSRQPIPGRPVPRQHPHAPTTCD
jgi:hypothetical protein